MPKKNLIYFLGFIFSIFLISTPHFSYGDNTVTVESFPVDYTIENGIVDTIFLDPDFISLIVTMIPLQMELLKLQFPDYSWMQNLTQKMIFSLF